MDDEFDQDSDFDLEFNSDEEQTRAADDEVDGLTAADIFFTTYADATTEQGHNQPYYDESSSTGGTFGYSLVNVEDIADLAVAYDELEKARLGKKKTTQKRHNQIVPLLKTDREQAKNILDNRIDDMAILFERIPTISKRTVTGGTNTNKKNTRQKRKNNDDHPAIIDIDSLDDASNHTSTAATRRKHQRQAIIDSMIENQQQVQAEKQNNKGQQDNSELVILSLDSHDTHHTQQSQDDEVDKHLQRTQLLKLITAQLREATNNNKNKTHTSQQQQQVVKVEEAANQELIDAMNISQQQQQEQPIPDSQPQKVKLTKEEKLAKLNQQRLQDRKQGLIEWRLLVQNIQRQLQPLEDTIYRLHVYPNIITPRERVLNDIKRKAEQAQQQHHDNLIDKDNTIVKTDKYSKKDQIENKTKIVQKKHKNDKYDEQSDIVDSGDDLFSSSGDSHSDDASNISDNDKIKNKKTIINSKQSKSAISTKQSLSTKKSQQSSSPLAIITNEKTKLLEQPKLPFSTTPKTKSTTKQATKRKRVLLDTDEENEEDQHDSIDNIVDDDSDVVIQKKNIKRQKVNIQHDDDVTEAVKLEDGNSDKVLRRSARQKNKPISQ